LPKLPYIGNVLYDVTFENPASGGASGAYNFELQDTGIQAGTTGKTLINETAISETASTDVQVSGDAVTGKFEALAGRLRMLVSDTDIGNTEYITILFTFIPLK
jgi:hypothetical protein